MPKILIPSNNPAVLAAVEDVLNTLVKNKTVFIERVAEKHRLDPEALGVILGTCIGGREKNIPVFMVVGGTSGLALPTVYLSAEMCAQLAVSEEQRTPSPF